MNIDNQFDGHTRFHGAAVARSLGGRTTRTNLAIYEAYVAAKFGPAEVAVGRFLSDTGLGMIAGAPFMDGVHVSVGNELVKGQAYVTKFGNVHSAQEYPDGLNGHMTFASGDVKVMPVKGLTVSLSYFADVTSADGHSPISTRPTRLQRRIQATYPQQRPLVHGHRASMAGTPAAAPGA